MPPRVPGRRRKILRRCFRGVRIAVLLIVFFLVAAGAYLNEVGLPDFLKRRMLQQLHDRGMVVQFSRLRLRWYRGVVAENVRFGAAAVEPAAGPQLSIREAELRLNHSALARFRLQVDSLILHDGRAVWELVQTNQPTLQLSVTNIQTQLRLLPNDLWELDQFSAAFAGANLRLSASITNASAFRDWKIFQAGAAPTPGLLQRRLRALAETIEHLKFDGKPELIVSLQGDARDERSFHGVLTLHANGADTPWGSVTNSTLVAHLAAATNATNQSEAEFSLHADQAATPWGSGSGLHLNLHATTDDTVTNRVRANLVVQAQGFNTPWAQAAGGRFTADWTHDLTNPVPLTGQAELAVTNARTRWGSAGTAFLSARLETPAKTPDQLHADEKWAGWAVVEPYNLEGGIRFTNLHVPLAKVGAVDLQELASEFRWGAPNLLLTNLHARLYDGGIDGRAELNVATRELLFAETIDFDAQQTAPLLSPGSQRWLQQYSWSEPPLVHGSGGLVLPAWTNREPDWQGEVLPTVWLNGDFNVGAAAFRGIPLTSAQFHFHYSNECWNLPDLVAIRPEGRIEMAHTADDTKHTYYFKIHSTIDVKQTGRLLGANGQSVMDSFTFTAPPEVDAEIWGHWRDPGQTGIKGRVTASNFTFRGESASRVETDVSFTNGFLLVTNPRLERPVGFVTATAVGVDFAAAKLYLTNVFSTLEAAPFWHVIGPRTAQEMEPYHFVKAPTVRANGVVPLDNEAEADLHVQLEGGPFNWMRFNLDHVSTGLDWKGDRLNLTDAKGEAYGGRLALEAAFDFKPGAGTDFSFSLDVTNANLHSLMSDIHSATNNLEGQLSGQLIVTRANARDWQSWFGSGKATLRDGLIWEIPAFGIISPVLDGIWEGLGKSRANGGTATFIITNSVIHSEDLEITASTYTMRYWGTVDFETRLNATVEARLLRKTPVLGPLLGVVFSPLTKLFEFKVTGTLADPKKEPIVPVVPRLLMMPFNPIQTIKDMIPPDKAPETSPPAGVK